MDYMMMYELYAEHGTVYVTRFKATSEKEALALYNRLRYYRIASWIELYNGEQLIQPVYKVK